MTRRTGTHAALATMTFVIICGGAAAQELHAPTGQGRLEVPIPLRVEHNQIRDELAKARQDGGGVGDAARVLERVWGPHLAQSEASVLPPLGVLRALTRNEAIPEAAQTIAMSAQLERDLPNLLEEQRLLYGETKRFMDVATREKKPAYVELARRLWMHLQMEEDVLYPTVLLIGRQLKARESTRPKPTTSAHR